MSKRLKVLSLLAFTIALTALPMLAQEAAAEPGQARTSLLRISLIVGGGIITLAVIAGAFCQAKAISAGCEGISRNPAAAPTIRFLLIFGLVLIETLVIYALLITIIILMVQWGNYLPKA
ncbi:MAG TPA: ATP synthase F0 subunit C [Acidobacteriota bacterium]|nr:ATP synthase F0 subunit C [Acidobacteriota bacterium]